MTPENSEKHLLGLNAAQQEAVKAQEPVLVLAGAGAGKTRTITARIVHLIRNGIEPESILAITFTNKAASEMKERVMRAVGELTGQSAASAEEKFPFVSTFHALATSIIRENSALMHLSRHFSIYDRADSKAALKDVMEEVGIDPKSVEPGRILSTISRHKGNLQSPDELVSEGGNYYHELVASLWERYDAKLRKEHALDFDDLLVEAIRLFKKHPEVLERYQRRWSHIHVDEYQDTNRAQYELVQILSATHKNVFAVGDVDQTIYTWRGARIKNLLHFERDYPKTTIIRLEENYRSTKMILKAANAVIKKNTVRFEKNLFTQNPTGDAITVFAAYDENDEAAFVADTIAQLIRAGAKPGSIAVLYRANFQSRALEQAMLEAQLPYQVLGTRFFERREVKDTLSYIKAALNPESGGDIKRAAGFPPRGIGKLTLLKMLAGKEHELRGSAREKVAAFHSLLARIKTKALAAKPSETIKFVLKESGIQSHLAHGSEDDRERLENVKELATVALSYDPLPPEEGIEKLLSDISLSSEQDEIDADKKSVRLMTVHASKGLEFDFVFITGLEQDLFPHEKKEGGEDLEEAEEERRLFYVALTRARRKVYLSHASVRTIFGARQVSVPSEFLSDIEDTTHAEERHPHRFLKIIKFD